MSPQGSSRWTLHTESYYQGSSNSTDALSQQSYLALLLERQDVHEIANP